MKTDQKVLVDLITAVQNEDRRAFALLYEEVSPRLFGIQLRILKDRAIAEDALQETFVKIWKSAKLYDHNKAQPNVWLNALARNQALDILRRAQTRVDVNLFVADAQSERVPDSFAGLDDSIANSELLNICLSRLKKDTQRCLVGMYCEGYTQDDLSKITGSPVGTIKSWIRRGLTSLKDCVNELS